MTTRLLAVFKIKEACQFFVKLDLIFIIFLYAQSRLCMKYLKAVGTFKFKLGNNKQNIREQAKKQKHCAHYIGGFQITCTLILFAISKLLQQDLIYFNLIFLLRATMQLCNFAMHFSYEIVCKI